MSAVVLLGIVCLFVAPLFWFAKSTHSCLNGFGILTFYWGRLVTLALGVTGIALIFLKN
jgi:hypothetical protein